MKTKWFLRQLSIFLVLALLLQLLPGQVLAADAVTPDQTGPVQQAETLSEDAQIVCELPEKRTEYSKEFRLAGTKTGDGSLSWSITPNR